MIPCKPSFHLSAKVESSKVKCCSDQGQLMSKVENGSLCFPILIPSDDPAYSSGQESKQCQHFTRTTTDIDKGCSSEEDQVSEQVRCFILVLI